jgi:hypothetical protein
MQNSKTILAAFLLILTVNVNSEWVHSSSGMHDLNVYCIAANENYIFAGTQQSLSVSSNNGINWYMVSFNSQLEPVHSIVVFGVNVFCGVQGYGVTVSPNNGGYWTFHHPLGNRTIYSLNYTNEGKLFAGASAMNPGSGAAGVYISNDNGYSFTPTSLLNKIVYSLTSIGNTVFAGTQNEGVYVTTDNGVSWNQTSLNNRSVKSLASNSNFIFAGTQGNGVYVSSDNGSSWVQTSLNNTDMNALALVGNSVFAGSSAPSNFYVSLNDGSDWILRNEGLGSVLVDAVCTINNFVFAGTPSNGVYRRSLNELVGIQPISNEIPNQYSLSQNYPNPFNPVTKIRFDIPPAGQTRAVDTRLIIYDMLGREISTLVNEQLNPGSYEVEWNASGYPSGVYFYNLRTASFSETRKMILLK